MIPAQLKRTLISFEKAEKRVSTLLSKLIDSRIIFLYPRLSTPLPCFSIRDRCWLLCTPQFSDDLNVEIAHNNHRNYSGGQDPINSSSLTKVGTGPGQKAASSFLIIATVGKRRNIPQNGVSPASCNNEIHFFGYQSSLVLQRVQYGAVSIDSNQHEE